MADTPLFYSSIVPLNRENHRDLRLTRPDKPFAFASKAHMIPALVEEFGVASRHIPIVFVPGNDTPNPVFLVGLQPRKNAFVAEDGGWIANYLPAFLRRYPFIIGEPDGGAPIICIDEASERLSREHGDRLFDEEGKDTPLMIERVRFANNFSTAATITRTLVAHLRDFDLMRPISIEAKTDGQSSAVVHGLLAVDEAKLAALSDDKFLQLRRDGVLGAIYAHLISLSAVDKLSAPIPAAA